MAVMSHHPKRDRGAHALTGVVIAIGAGLGLLAGMQLDHSATGVVIGAGLGTLVGAVIESQRRRS